MFATTAYSVWARAAHSAVGGSCANTVYGTATVRSTPHTSRVTVLSIAPSSERLELVRSDDYPWKQKSGQCDVGASISARAAGSQPRNHLAGLLRHRLSPKP